MKSYLTICAVKVVGNVQIVISSENLSDYKPPHDSFAC